MLFPPSELIVNPNPTILVGCSQKVVCIRVQGKGSFLNSTGIKKFANAMIERGHRNFVVDLADCPVMDSTFMGTLTGVALRLHGIGQGDLHVINSNERNTGPARRARPGPDSLPGTWRRAPASSDL